MNVLFIRRSIIFFLSAFLAACSTAKLEARLEANPQCKEIVNPKTGAVMPCPGSDKAFYKSVGLEPPKAQTNLSPTPVNPSNLPLTSESTTPAVKQVQVSAPSADCKPSLHKKTGNVLPCPSPD